MDENKTIAQITGKNLCTGCGTCIALCPRGAIKLTINRNKGIYIPELSELDLAPVKNLDGLADINDKQYAESDEINTEAAQFVQPYVVTNGRGAETPSKSTFDDNFFE